MVLAVAFVSLGPPFLAIAPCLMFATSLQRGTSGTSTCRRASVYDVLGYLYYQTYVITTDAWNLRLFGRRVSWEVSIHTFQMPF